MFLKSEVNIPQFFYLIDTVPRPQIITLFFTLPFYKSINLDSIMFKESLFYTLVIQQSQKTKKLLNHENT